MAVYISKKFSTPEEFEAWIAENEHGNKEFLDNLCEQDKQRWDTKACQMTVKDGKLQLLCENGNVLAETDYYVPDNDTACCDGQGKIIIKGFKDANSGNTFNLWVGTKEEYDAIRVKNSRMCYWITDDDTLNKINSMLTTIDEKLKSIENGTLKVGAAAEADHAGSASFASLATHSSTAENATNAVNAEHATEAGYAEHANNATYAENANEAGRARTAENADNATSAGKATRDALGNVIAETYGNFANEWSGGFMAYPRISTAGTYQIVVTVANKDTFSTSVLAYWNGNTAVTYDICTACDTTNGKMRTWRLIISADGSTHVQYSEIDVRSGTVGAWTEIEYYNSTAIKNNVSINYRKII